MAKGFPTKTSCASSAWINDRTITGPANQCNLVARCPYGSPRHRPRDCDAVRTFDEDVRKRVLAAIERIVNAEAEASRAPKKPEITRRCTSALRRACLHKRSRTLFQHARVQPFLDEPHDASVRYPMLEKLDQPCMRQPIEKAAHVQIQHPIHSSLMKSAEQGVQRSMLAASWPEPIREAEKVAFVKNDPEATKQQLKGADFKVRFTIFATMRSSVRSRVAPPLLNNLQVRILRLYPKCSNSVDYDPLFLGRRRAGFVFSASGAQLILPASNFLRDWTYSARAFLPAGVSRYKEFGLFAMKLLFTDM